MSVWITALAMLVLSVGLILFRYGEPGGSDHLVGTVLITVAIAVLVT